MVITKWISILCVLYVLFSSYVIYTSVVSYHTSDTPRLFLKDPNAQSRITAAIAVDHNMPLIARILHNKLLVSWQVFCDGIYRSVDIPFLFSLTERSSLYDNHGRIQMLPPFELPFFFLSVIVFLRRWEKLKRFGFILLGALGVSLLISGILWPFLFPLKLIPLMLTIQAFLFIGTVVFVEELLWRKK